MPPSARMTPRGSVTAITQTKAETLPALMTTNNMGRKTMEKKEAQRIGALGAKSYWAKMTPAQRSKEMKRRLAIRYAK